MVRRNLRWLLGIVLLVGLASWAILTPEIYLPLGEEGFHRKGMTLGLDLRGGTHLILQADLSGREPEEREDAVEGVKRIIERRINAYGVTEPVIQRQGEDRILLQLPGVRDIEEAVRLVGQTAQLDFREIVLDEDDNPVLDEEGNPQWAIATAIGSDGKEKELTGEHFKKAQANVTPQTFQPIVEFEWDKEGAVLFKQVTERNIGKPLGIFLDNELISSPIVRAVIEERGIIESGTWSINEAELLAIQFNAGALPVPVEIVQQQDVDATLGEDSIRKSIMAGVIGLVLVLLFLILYYRLPGVLAGLALLIYGVLVLAIFKLVPVTLTLAGIAAFILSLGMAVDANVLIFERLKEELREKRTFISAVEAGFARAWPAIRDSNVSTFIICGILYWFGARFGASPIMGFALTLFIGVATSMFTAIVVTRTFLRLLGRSPLGRIKSLFTV
jgi:preprotein translocase subunit SecD